jgi:peptide/nickel transport system ATP-binding protein
VRRPREDDPVTLAHAVVDVREQAAVAGSPLVDVRDLSLRLVSRDMNLTLLHGVSFTLQPGEVLCLVGESGSGKSVTLRSLLRLLPPAARLGGAVRIAGIDVGALTPRGLLGIRGSLVSMIFQEPASALDPTFTIGQQIGENVRVHEHVSRTAARRRALDLLELVQVPSAARRLDAYPHELSGGLRQRAMIALALSCRPKLLLADEPTTALDATVQIQVLLLLRQLQRELGMGIIFVTHDVGVACEIADRVAVMYAGRLVETGPIEEVFAAPAHPYTAGLLRSVVHAQARGSMLEPIAGAPPDLAALPPGCSFAPRCGYARTECAERMPDLIPVSATRSARCLLVTSGQRPPAPPMPS